MKQKKNNGFTLVELLAVIALLGIIGTIATTSAINISKKLKSEMLCDKIEFITNAGKTYGSDIYDSLSMDSSNKVEITVGDLVKKGYLKKDQDVDGNYIINPDDDSSMDNWSVEIYRKNNRAYAHVVAPADYDISSCNE